MSRKNKPAKPADGSMTIVEHINELRRRVMVALAAILVGTIVGYIWYGTSIDTSWGHISSLGEVLRQPYCNLPADMRFGASDGECRLLATSPFEMFLLRLKVGFLAGLVFSSPVWLGQIWGYITPGLKKNEKRWTLGVSLMAGFLFTVGAVLAYFVLSIGLEFLMGIGDEAQIAALNGQQYFSFALGLLLVFGVSFEVPLITVLLNVAGVVSYQQLKQKRRFIWAFLFVFAAFITPGQDPISMVILALSLCAMMEIATQVARLNDKRRKNNQEEWLTLDDEQGSAIAPASSISGSGAVGSASTIEAPSAVTEVSGVQASPAPRSSGAHRQQQEYGRRSGLDLRRGEEGGSGYFDDVL
ncbi:MAG TPA: twin-arginine translocase subunit TatC [Candidatus Corynebacterium gallistercoris]|uniref:Sec-independent protein translocase protein TatC n=1 Tax=Candidatus Corynebacterium gallistercoris TaxID=2838530 RepID=A0A9D1S089_9CORY|nr:twin-arginine translocase subunit TatC [Candidatus Corynebacterium gallistercoris]